MSVLISTISAILIDFGCQVSWEGIKKLYGDLRRKIDVEDTFIKLFEKELCASFQDLKLTFKNNREKILDVIHVLDNKQYDKLLTELKKKVYYQNIAKECSIILNLVSHQKKIESIIINVFNELRKKVLEKLPDRLIENLKLQRLENIDALLQKIFIDTERLYELKNRYLNSLNNSFRMHNFYGLSSPRKLSNCELEKLFVIPDFNLLETSHILESSFKIPSVLTGVAIASLYLFINLFIKNKEKYSSKILEKIYFSNFIKDDRKNLNLLDNVIINPFYYNIQIQNQLLLSGRKLIFLGNPGCGKSTYMRYLVLINSSDELSLKYHDMTVNRYPIFLELRKFAKNKKIYEEKGKNYKIIDFIVESVMQVLESNEIKNIQDLVRNLLEDEGNCLVIFDGYDEILDAKLQVEIRDQIILFIANYNKNLFIITSRKVGYEEVKFTGEDFIHLELKEFNERQKEELITKFFNAFDKGDLINNLNAIIRNNEKINDLASNPLMLTIMCFMTLTGLNISQNNRWELLKNCTETFLDTWIAFKGLEKRNTQKVLRELGYWFHSFVDNSEIQSISVNKSNLVNKLLEIFQKLPQYENAEIDIIKKDMEDTLKYIKTTNGLLIEQNIDEFKFPYLLIQEFFAASYINYSYADVKDIWKEIKEKIPLIHWREILILLMGMVSENEQRIINLIKKKILNYYKRSPAERSEYLLFLITILCEKVSINQKLRIDIILEILKDKQILTKNLFEVLENQMYILDKTNLSLFENYLNIYPNDIILILKELGIKLDDEEYFIFVLNLLFHNLMKLKNSNSRLIIIQWIIEYGINSRYETIKILSNLCVFKYGISESLPSDEMYFENMSYIFKNLKIKNGNLYYNIDIDKLKVDIKDYSAVDLFIDIIHSSLILLNKFSKNLIKVNEILNFLNVDNINTIIDKYILQSGVDVSEGTPFIWVLTQGALIDFKEEVLLNIYKSFDTFTPKILQYLIRIILINIILKDLISIENKSIKEEISQLILNIPKGTDKSFISEFEKLLTLYQDGLKNELKNV